MKSVFSFTILIFVVLTFSSFAQFYGVNKVQYEDFDWHYIQSEHFASPSVRAAQIIPAVGDRPRPLSRTVRGSPDQYRGGPGGRVDVPIQIVSHGQVERVV